MFASRIFAILLKEFNHIFRDPRTLAVIFLMPVLQLIIFGYAMNMEIKSIRLAVFDYSRSTSSRELIQRFSASETYRIGYPSVGIGKLHELFCSRNYQAALIIPSDLETALHREHKANVQLIVDAADPNAATMIKAYTIGVVHIANQIDTLTPLQVSTNIMFNPDLKSAFFFVPGLVAMILVMICALLTSIAITREKELGTMEQILVSPIKSHEIIIGKVIPYIVLALIDALLILIIGMTLFGVPFRGSFPVFLLFTLLYILTALSLGLLISTVAKSQQTAMMFALAITLLPTLMLSGFIFPIASMPKLLQYVTYIVPAKYYLQIIRGIMLKGNTLHQLLQPALVLVAMTLAMLSLAIKRFSLRLK
jgi:ABC-2 type transport system permease protein